MAKKPPHYLSFHVGDYLKNPPYVGPGTWEHHGIYWALRFVAWNTPGCKISTSERWISRQLGCTPEILREKVLPVLHQHFKLRRGWWYDDDLSTTHRKAVEFGERQSRAAKARHEKEKKSTPSNAYSLLPSKEQQQHTKLDSSVEKKKVTRRWASSFKSDPEA